MKILIISLIVQMQTNLASSQGLRLSLKALLSPGILSPILITICLVASNQLCGISAVNFYTVDIFKKAAAAQGPSLEGQMLEGLSLNVSMNNSKQTGFVLDSNLAAILVQLVQVGAVFLSSLLVDRAGRRVLLLASFAIMATSLLGLGSSFYSSETLVGNRAEPQKLFCPIFSKLTTNYPFFL